MTTPWGYFPEVRPPAHRLYVRAYWRYLLKWGALPSTLGISAADGSTLRSLARTELNRYRAYAAASTGTTVLEMSRTKPTT